MRGYAAPHGARRPDEDRLDRHEHLALLGPIDRQRRRDRLRRLSRERARRDQRSDDLHLCGLELRNDLHAGRRRDRRGGNRSAKSGLTAATAACPDMQSPSPPTGLTKTGSTGTSISIAWTASTDNVGVTGYGNYRDGALIAIGPGTTYTYVGLTCGTTYTLAVDASDAAGNRSPTAALTASTNACTDTQAPTAPTGLATTGSSTTSISVAWTASTDNVGVAGYDLYSAGSKLGTTSSTSYTYSGLKCGTSYTLGVDAYDSAGNVSSTAKIVAATVACSSSLLGTEVLGTYADYNPPGWSEAFSSVASSSGTLGALRVYVDSQSTAPSLVAGLYSDANGAPGSLLGQGSVTPATGAWNNVPLPAISVAAGRTYWIALLAPSGTLYYRDTCLYIGHAGPT